MPIISTMMDFRQEHVMRRLLYMIVFVSLSFACSVSAVCPMRYQPAGRVRARHAREIESSNWSVGAETMDRGYTVYQYWKSYLGPLGFKKARIQGGWAKTEKRKGQYDWGWLDEIIYDMADQGVEPWMCLCYGNSLYADGGGTRLGASLPSSGTALAEWKKWVRATVERYKEHISEWEVWNEPNLRGVNGAATYAGFLIATAEVIREVQPQAKILAMSTAGVQPRYTDEVLGIVGSRGKLHMVDQVTYHPYKSNPDDSYDEVEKLRAVVAGHSARITIRQGENGAPSARRNTKALSNYDWTELSQAKWALRRLLGDLGRDIESSYFAIMDMKYPDEMNMKGLLKSSEDQRVEYAKPSYYALQNLAAVFDSKLQRIPEYRFSAQTEESLSVFGYENRRSGAQVVTVWFDGEIPSESNEKTCVDLIFPQGRFAQPCYVDLHTGEVFHIPADDWSRSGAVCSFPAVPCYDCPILIADRSNIPIDGDSGQ